jgi:hypothetical protein
MSHYVKLLGWSVLVTAIVICLNLIPEAPSDDQPAPESKDLLAQLKTYSHKIVYESNRDGNFDLYVVNAVATSSPFTKRSMT